jgi:hypothetical protein
MTTHAHEPEFSAAGRKPKSTPEQIIHAAWELFEEVGFESATMSEIASRAGLSRRSLFNYFNTKDALLFPGVSEFMDEFAVLVSQRPADESLFASLEICLDGLEPKTEELAERYAPGPEVSRARISQEAVSYSKEVWAREMEQVALSRLGNGVEAQIRAALIGAIAAQLWIEMTKLQRQDPNRFTQHTALVFVMNQLREIFGQ